MSPADERDYLERVLARKAQPNLSPSGTLGRLAELYLQAPETPGFAERALALVQIGFELESASSSFYPKFRHFQAMALRSLKQTPKDALGTNGKAAEADREAWSLSLKTNPLEAIAFAGAWGDWAWERALFEEAAQAYSNAHRAQRHLLLNEAGGEAARVEMLNNSRFATRGAFALHKIGQIQNAILLLEQTSVFGLNANQQRAELGQLEQANLPLSEKLKTAMTSRAEIRGRFGRDAFGSFSPAELKAQANVDSIVADIRSIPGFEAFAARPSWNDVVEASAFRPLAYLAPTAKGTVCFAVFPGEKMVRGVTSIDIPVNTVEIQDAFAAFAKGEYGDAGDRRGALYALLEWIGSRVMFYVKVLLENKRKEGPFVIIPFGLLSSLPIHLGIIRPDETRVQSLFHPRNVTFAYSARGFGASQRRSLRQNPAPRALVVSNPRPIPPTFDSLLLGDFEARIVSSYFESDLLTGRDATTEAVIELLPAATVAHFICHGTVDSRFSYTGILLLANTAAFNYEQLRMLPELAARLVVLSACRSGSASMTIEHCLNLPNAFLAAGASAVLGTFWHTDELASLLLVTQFYEFWLKKQMTPVEALGEAQAWLMATPAASFRAIVDSEVLKSPAAGILNEAAADDRIYAHPWFWGGFFLAGA